MQSRVSVLNALIPTAVLLLAPAGVLEADTVYLKNGAYIDGLVAARGRHVLTINIGDIGKLEIMMEDVLRVEKNSRTGSRAVVPVDQRELPEVVQEKNREREADESGEEEKGDAEGDDSDADEDEDEAEKEIDPELKAEIENLVRDLQRHKTKHRRRAERKLQRIGSPAVPFLLPLVTRGGDLTRITALRLVSEHAEQADPEIIEACLKALSDENYFVRDYGVKTLRRLTEEDFGYQAKAGNRSRNRAERKWQKWWRAEKKRLEDESDEADADADDEDSDEPEADEDDGSDVEGDDE